MWLKFLQLGILVNSVLLAIERPEDMDRHFSSSEKHYKDFLCLNNEESNNQKDVYFKLKEAIEKMDLNMIVKITTNESTEETFFNVISELYRKKDDKNTQKMIDEILDMCNVFDMNFSHEKFLSFFENILIDGNPNIIYDCLSLSNMRKIQIPYKLLTKIPLICMDKDFTREDSIMISCELFPILKENHYVMYFENFYEYLFNTNYFKDILYSINSENYLELRKDMLDYMWKTERGTDPDFIFYIFNKYCDFYELLKNESNYEMIEDVFSYMKDNKIILPMEMLYRILKTVSKIDQIKLFKSFIRYLDDMNIVFSKEMINAIILKKKHNTMRYALDYACKNNLLATSTMDELIKYTTNVKFNENESWIFYDFLDCIKKYQIDISHLNIEELIKESIEKENHFIIKPILSYLAPYISDGLLEAIFKKGLKSENENFLIIFFEYSGKLNRKIEKEKIHSIIEVAFKKKNDKLLKVLLDCQQHKKEETQHFIISFMDYAIDTKNLSLLSMCISCANKNHISLPKGFLIQLLCKMIPEYNKFDRMIDELKNFLYEREIYISPKEIQSKIDPEFLMDIPNFIYKEKRLKIHSASQLNIMTCNNLEEIRKKLDEINDTIKKKQEKKQEYLLYTEEENLKQYVSYMEEEEEEKNIKQTNLFVKERLDAVLKPGSYLASVLYDYSLNFFTGSGVDDVREKFLTYCQHLLSRNLWTNEIDALFLDDLIENWIANSVSDWTINEQEALIFLLKQLPISGLKAHTNLFEASCQPGATNRILLLFNKIESACEEFVHHETEKNFSKRVYDIYKQKIFQIFDTKLYVADNLPKKEEPFMVEEEIKEAIQEEEEMEIQEEIEGEEQSNHEEIHEEEKSDHEEIHEEKNEKDLIPLHKIINEDEIEDIKINAYAYIINLFPHELDKHFYQDDIENSIMSLISDDDIREVLESMDPS